MCVYVVIWISVLGLLGDTWWRSCKTDKKLRPSIRASNNGKKNHQKLCLRANCHHRLILCFTFFSLAFTISKFLFVSHSFTVVFFFGGLSVWDQDHLLLHFPPKVCLAYFTSLNVSSSVFVVWHTLHNRFSCQNPCHFPSLFQLSHSAFRGVCWTGASNFSSNTPNSKPTFAILFSTRYRSVLSRWQQIRKAFSARRFVFSMEI